MTRARVRRSQNGRASALNKSGTAATAAPAVTSERMLARRNPKRSTSGPPVTDDNSVPIPTTAPARPICTTLPVVFRTNHGSATATIMSPTCDTAFALSTAYSGVRPTTRCRPGVFGIAG
jgi:hypothetical protein